MLKSLETLKFRVLQDY